MSGEIIACAASGNASAEGYTPYAGGFAGSVDPNCIVKASYATGKATATTTGDKEFEGSFAGDRDASATVADCYGVGATLVGGVNGDANGMTAKTEAEMKTATFTALLNTATQGLEAPPIY